MELHVRLHDMVCMMLVEVRGRYELQVDFPRAPIGQSDLSLP